MRARTGRDARPSPPRRWESLLAGAGLAVMAAITLANVVVRYLTNQSFAWTEEVSVALMVVVTLLGTSAAVALGQHIRIEFVAERGSSARRRALGIVAALATLVVFGLLAALGARMAWDDYRFGVTSPGIGVPQWWYTVWLPVLCGAVVARAAVAMRRAVRARRLP